MNWINVEDGQPDPKLKHIIVYSLNKHVHTVHWDYDDWLLWETDVGFAGEGIDFTHWMTLPPPPESP